jgi:hypothetical protein
MEKTPSIKELAKALMLFHVKMGKISKDAANPFYKSKYASLSNILEQIQIPLAESGLCFTQFPTDNNTLTTILVHSESGEYIQGSYCITPVKNDPQSVGSAITYARRYALGAILGLNIDDDDDGNAASGKGENKTEDPADTRPWLNDNTETYLTAVETLKNGGCTVEQIELKYKLSKAIKTKLQSLIK